MKTYATLIFALVVASAQMAGGQIKAVVELEREVRHREVACWEAVKSMDLDTWMTFFDSDFCFDCDYPNLRAEVLGDVGEERDYVSEVRSAVVKIILMMEPGSLGFELDRFHVLVGHGSATAGYEFTWWGDHKGGAKIGGRSQIWHKWDLKDAEWKLTRSHGEPLQWQFIDESFVPAN